MKINLLILLAVVVLAGIWTYFSDQGRPPVNPMTTAENAPDFKYTTINGKKGNLSDHRGKIVLVHFWASWCPPCIVEFPELLKLAQNQENNMVLLAVSTDKVEKDITKFIKSLKMTPAKNVYVIQDKEENISKGLYKTSKLPETYIISGDSVVIEKITGPQKSWNTAIWHKKISSGYSE